MFFKLGLFVVCSVFVYSDSASYFDTLGKCKIRDKVCLKELLQSIVTDVAKTGVKELDIPQIDPLTVNNISMSILNMAEITVIEGTAKGAKDCVVRKFDVDVDGEHAFLELKCDFSIKGRYRVFSNSPLLKTFVGGETLEGEGNAKVKIEKLVFKLDFDFFIKKRDGEFFITPKSDKIKYSYDVGKMQFFLDNIYIGKQESSKLVTGLLNDNWRSMQTFAKPYIDNAMDLVFGFMKKFFATVPAKSFISDDLSSYARDAA